MSYRLTLKRPEDIPPSEPDVGPGLDGDVTTLIVRDEDGFDLASVSVDPEGAISLVGPVASMVIQPEGNIEISGAGASTITMGTDGEISLNVGGSYSLIIQADGEISLIGTGLQLTGAPINSLRLAEFGLALADPEVMGEVWTDPADGFTLKMSQGAP